MASRLVTGLIVSSGSALGRSIGRGAPKLVALGTMAGVFAGTVVGLAAHTLAALVLGVCLGGLIGAGLGASLNFGPRGKPRPRGWMGAIRKTWERHGPEFHQLLILTDHALFWTTETSPPWSSLLERIGKGFESSTRGMLAAESVRLDEFDHMEIREQGSSITFATGRGPWARRQTLVLKDPATRDAVVAEVLGCLAGPHSREERVLELGRVAFAPLLVLTAILWMTTVVVALAIQWQTSPPETGGPDSKGLEDLVRLVTGLGPVKLALAGLMAALLPAGWLGHAANHPPRVIVLTPSAVDGRLP
jgi:hypothetical protein